MLQRRPAGIGLPKRLLPLHFAVALQGFSLWVPVEKLFLSEIGFDAASVGVMAAAYAAIVPLAEVPSGILADRWSRRGVLVLSSVALAGASLIGGLATNVTTYIVGMLLLGVYFAMYNGTMEAVVYDTVLEVAGGSEHYERRIGRVRAVESALLVAGSLVGGWVAELAGPRVTYWLTIPFVLLSIVAYLRFTEPKLHKADAAGTLRAHLVITYRALLGQRRLVPLIALTVLATLSMQAVFEFGPLWLVAMAVPAVLYGPYWAALISTLGLGGLLAGWPWLRSRAGTATVAGLLVLSSLSLTMGVPAGLVLLAQTVLALLLVTVSIRASHLLHDAVPSAVRTGVAAGVSSVSWLAFLPVALLFGTVSKEHGVHDAGWLLVGATALAGTLLISQIRRAKNVTEMGRVQANG